MQRKRRRLGLEQLNARHMLAGDTLNYPPSLYQESFYLPHDTVLSGQVNAYDPEGASLSPILLAVPSQGNLSINSDLTFQYIPNHNFAGSDSFTLAVFDGFNMSDSVTFHLEVTNYAPSAESSSFSTPHGVSLSASLVAYDYDGDPITASIDSLPANGTLFFNPDLTFSYQPNSSFSGTDSFSFIVSDGIASSSPIFVAINVTNHEPYAESSTLSTRHGTLLTGQLTGNDYDGDPFTASLVSEPTNGAILVNPDLSFSYQPQTGFVGTDSFSFVLFDGIASSYPATVTMNVVNSTPMAEPGTFVLDGHGELSGSVYGYDYDGDSVVAKLISPTASGTLILNPNFTFSYVPAENFNGFDSFSFVAFDGIEQSAAATVSIEVLNNTVVDLPEPPLPIVSPAPVHPTCR